MRYWILLLAFGFVTYGCSSDEDPPADQTTRVCNAGCDTASTCGGVPVDTCLTTCDGLLRPVLETDAAPACASESQIDACAAAVQATPCALFLISPDPIPDACDLCGVDFNEVLASLLSGGDGGLSFDAAVFFDAGEADAGAGDADTMDAGEDAGEGDAGEADAGEMDAGDSPSDS